MQILLPHTDLQVSALCLGSGEIGSSLDQTASFALLDCYLEQGGNFLDTAHNYGDWVRSLPRSASERTIGAWMKSRGVRDRIVLATKGAHWHLDAPDIPRLSRKDIVDDLDGSLECLGTDRIDLYWLHRDDPATPVEDILETLESQRQAGKIRYYGASNWRTDRLRDARRLAEARQIPGFIADQVLWNAAVPRIYPYGDFTVGFMDETRFIFHEQTGMTAIPFQSQAFGLFQRMASGTLEQMNPGFRGFYRREESARRFARMQQIMGETGRSITQVVLGFLRGQPFTTVPIIGCRSLDHLQDSMTALDTILTPDQIRFILHG